MKSQYGNIKLKENACITSPANREDVARDIPQAGQGMPSDHEGHSAVWDKTADTTPASKPAEASRCFQLSYLNPTCLSIWLRQYLITREKFPFAQTSDLVCFVIAHKVVNGHWYETKATGQYTNSKPS